MLHVYSFVCVLLAGIVRGFSGFAFATLAIMSLSLLLPLSTVVPAVFLLEVVAGIHLLPAVRKAVEWRSIGLVVGSSIVFTPLGVYALSSVPAEPMKVVLAVFSLISAALLFFGYQLRRMPTRAEATATGSLAGLLNGAFGIGGWPIIIFFLARPWLWRLVAHRSLYLFWRWIFQAYCFFLLLTSTRLIVFCFL